MITSHALTEMRTYLKNSLSYVRYLAGGVYHQASIHSIALQSDGRISVMFVISSAATGGNPVTEVQLYGTDDTLWISKTENILSSSIEEGILYRFYFTIQEMSAAATPDPVGFTFTGLYLLLDDGDGNWRIRFLTSGIFMLTEAALSVDICMVGGGGGGKGGGGGGGYTNTARNVPLAINEPYLVLIGAGGPQAEAEGETSGRGGTTSFDIYSAAGGYGGVFSLTAGKGGDGGSGGGGYNDGAGGSDGSGGVSGEHGDGGTGQGTTTREFGEEDGELYAPGGSAELAVDAEGLYDDNSGRGGSGKGESGASGIVVLRNAR